MKKNWTIRIALIAFVCFGLAVIFGKMAGEEMMLNYWVAAATKIDGKKFESSYIEEAVFVSELSEIEVLSTGVDIKLENSDDEKLHLSYYKNTRNKNEQLYSKDNNRIIIDFGQLEYSNSDIKINFNKANFGLTIKDAKVNVQVPKNITKVKIKTVSGETKIVNINSDFIQVESVSGDFDLRGNFKNLKSSTVSGDVKFQSEILNPSAKLSTISGDIKITFNKDPDINLNFETTSGDIKFDKSFLKTEIEGSVKDLKFGNGSGLLEINTVSGDLEILKK